MLLFREDRGEPLQHVPFTEVPGEWRLVHGHQEERTDEKRLQNPQGPKRNLLPANSSRWQHLVTSRTRGPQTSPGTNNYI